MIFFIIDQALTSMFMFNVTLSWKQPCSQWRQPRLLPKHPGMPAWTTPSCSASVHQPVWCSTSPSFPTTLHSRHWLPAAVHIQIKTLVLTHKVQS